VPVFALLAAGSHPPPLRHSRSGAAAIWNPVVLEKIWVPGVAALPRNDEKSGRILLHRRSGRSEAAEPEPRKLFLSRERLFQPAVYILASQRNGTLYTGVTSDLLRRIYEHREGMVPGFTRKYGVKLLVWFEMHATMEHAIIRETRIKGWKRAWKLELIEAANPDWRDLYETLL